MKHPKHKLLIAFCLLAAQLTFSAEEASSQVTIVLHPNAQQGKDAIVTSLEPTTNYGDHGDLLMTAWTSGGVPLTTRSLIRFDLSSIPANATILSAKLSLYWNNDPSNVGHSTLDGSNACLVTRITSSWDEHQVTWNTQPAYTFTHAVTIPTSTNDTEDYPNIKVTALVQDMLTYGNNGFLIRLKTESYYRSMLFASSDDGDAWRRPKLKITYILNEPKISSPLSPIDFSVYPTLANHTVHVSCTNDQNRNFTVQIYNIAGVLETGREFSGETELNVESLDPGIYFLAIIDSNGRKMGMKKIVKE